MGRVSSVMAALGEEEGAAMARVVEGKGRLRSPFLLSLGGVARFRSSLSLGGVDAFRRFPSSFMMLVVVYCCSCIGSCCKVMCGMKLFYSKSLSSFIPVAFQFHGGNQKKVDKG